MWCNVGVLDYDPESKLYYVQKVNNKNRIIDEQGKPVVNGNIVDGKYDYIYFVVLLKNIGVVLP